MDLAPFVERLRSQLAAAADVGGDDARAIAERLTAPLESAIRLMLLEVLSAAADEITVELAPGSVELRLRAGEPDFVVSHPPTEDRGEAGNETLPRTTSEADEGPVTRINLRLPEQLKAEIERAASHDRLSVNAWLVRAAAASVGHGDRGHPGRGGRIGQTYTGWVR